MQVGDSLLNYPHMQNIILPMYIAVLARSGWFTTMKTYLNGVRVFYQLRGYPNPLADHFGLNHQKQGLKRKKPGGKKRKLPITIALLHAIVSSRAAPSTHLSAPR
jgi:hypothetical protein